MWYRIGILNKSEREYWTPWLANNSILNKVYLDAYICVEVNQNCFQIVFGKMNNLKFSRDQFTNAMNRGMYAQQTASLSPWFYLAELTEAFFARTVRILSTLIVWYKIGTTEL